MGQLQSIVSKNVNKYLTSSSHVTNTMDWRILTAVLLGNAAIVYISSKEREAILEADRKEREEERKERQEERKERQATLALLQTLVERRNEA
jgi:hypothetical protein